VGRPSPTTTLRLSLRHWPAHYASTATLRLSTGNAVGRPSPTAARRPPPPTASAVGRSSCAATRFLWNRVRTVARHPQPPSASHCEGGGPPVTTRCNHGGLPPWAAFHCDRCGPAVTHYPLPPSAYISIYFSM
jgi:hypothetical protein